MSKNMIPAQLETKEEAEQVSASKFHFSFPFSGCMAPIPAASKTEAEQPEVRMVAWADGRR